METIFNIEMKKKEEAFFSFTIKILFKARLAVVVFLLKIHDATNN